MKDFHKNPLNPYLLILVIVQIIALLLIMVVKLGPFGEDGVNFFWNNNKGVGKYKYILCDRSSSMIKTSLFGGREITEITEIIDLN